MSDKAQVRFIDNTTGNSTTIAINPGTTIDVFLQEQGLDPTKVTATLDRKPTTADTVIPAGSTISATPSNVKGN